MEETLLILRWDGTSVLAWIPALVYGFTVFFHFSLNFAYMGCDEAVKLARLYILYRFPFGVDKVDISNPACS